MASGIRLDKWLQVARVFKTRSQATRACSLSRVKVNGQTAKAHRNLELEDKVEVEFNNRAGDWSRVLLVKELRDKTLPKKEAPRVYEDISPPRPKMDAFERMMRRTPVIRERGKGRPSKKERREMDKFRSGDG